MLSKLKKQNLLRKEGNITYDMEQIKRLIASTVKDREELKSEMKIWYDEYPTKKFPKSDKLISTDAVLSELDNNYKRLWDFHNRQRLS